MSDSFCWKWWRFAWLPRNLRPGTYTTVVSDRGGRKSWANYGRVIFGLYWKRMPFSMKGWDGESP